MATRKTATKASTTVKKAPVKAAAKPRSKSTRPAVSASMKMSSVKTSSAKNSPTIADFQKNILDPKNRKTVYIALVVIVIAVAILFGKSLVVAALVNGQPVSRLSIIHDLEAQSGKAALDAAITRMLVFQEAAKKNITVTEKDIDAEIAKIQKQFQKQGQNLDQLLSTQGLTKEKFRDEVKVQLLVTKILGSQVKVTDKEFEDFMAKNPDLISSEKDQATAKANLRQQMEQQKLAQKYQEWIATIKKNAKINTFVNY